MTAARLLRTVCQKNLRQFTFPAQRYTTARPSTSPIEMPRISDTIKQDHSKIASIYDRIIKSTDPDERTRFQNLFTWELARHSIGEELVVYPAFERHISGGKALADKDREEHQSVKEKLKKFQDLGASDPDFIPTIQSLMEDLSNHIEEEETNDLVELENAIDSHESEDLSKSFSRTKMFIPTRSHPSAPNKPPFETAVGLMTAPIDQVADLFRKWPESA